MRATFLAAAVAVGLAVASPASAANVKGRIDGFLHLVNPAWAEAKDPNRHRYSFREPVPTVPAKFRRLFPHVPKEICIAAIAKTAQKHEPILIRVGGGRTTPVTLVVPPGTKLQFQNTDPFKHRLFGVGVQTFGPSDTGKGALREWSVPAAGSFEIRDELAPSLQMFVIGEPNVAKIAYPSMKGEFLLALQDDGEYVVQAYFAGKKVGDPQTVTVAGRDVVLPKPIVVATQKKSDDDDDDKKEEKKAEKKE